MGKLRVTLLAITVLIMLSAIAYAVPDGATVSAGAAETKTATAAGSYVSQGGNITPINVSGQVQTNVWQGFFGEVSGSITLRDATGDQMYNWSLTNTTGEVYASRSSSIDFASVTGVTDCTTDETLTGTGNDRVNSTFTSTAVAGWSVGSVSISTACQTFTHVNNLSQSSVFEEIIINATSVQSIYTTKISADTIGYDNSTHDYQMIVPENSTVATTTYFFFVELG